jgi:hypothetical protein
VASVPSRLEATETISRRWRAQKDGMKTDDVNRA